MGRCGSLLVAVIVVAGDTLFVLLTLSAATPPRRSLSKSFSVRRLYGMDVRCDPQFGPILGDCDS